MITRRTPDEWKTPWKLFRRRTEPDRLGTPKNVYSEEPDFFGRACIQTKTTAETAREIGEKHGATAEFVVFDDTVEISAFDRVEACGHLWEVTGVKQWPSHRCVELAEVRKL